MIRDRVKAIVKRAALKAFGMEFDAEARQSFRPPAGAETFDATKIPRIVDGSGDTPGPNHRELIGRTWLAAQVIGGVPGMLLDIRPPEEWIVGHLPGAVLLPGGQIKARPELLPAKTERVTVYDATGALGSEPLAAWLRDQGWTMARALVGGWAEWIEHSEPIAHPTKPTGARHQLGDTVALKDGRQGVVQGVRVGPKGERLDVLLNLNDDVVALDVPLSELKA